MGAMQAHLEKGKIFLKEGNFESAQAELKLYVKASPADTAGTELVSLSSQIGNDLVLADPRGPCLSPLALSSPASPPPSQL